MRERICLLVANTIDVIVGANILLERDLYETIFRVLQTYDTISFEFFENLRQGIAMLTACTVPILQQIAY